MKLLIFDLGNVFCEVDFDKAIRFWSRESGIDQADLRSRFHQTEEYEQFERGQIAPHTFFQHLKSELALDIPVDAIANGWNSIFGSILEPNYSAMLFIAQRATAVVLSNTNAAHYPVWLNLYRTELDIFHKVYVSHQLGMRKPEPRIFNFVLHDCQVAPADAVFFDDNAANIDSARSLGMEAVLVTDNRTVQNWIDHKAWADSS